MDRFDGYSVDSYAGRFSGTFDIEDRDGRKLRHGDEVIMLVTAKVGRATMDENTLGDMKRTQTFKAEIIRFVDPENASETLTALGIPHQLKLVPQVLSTWEESSVEEPPSDPVTEVVDDVLAEHPVVIPEVVGSRIATKDETLARFLSQTAP